MSVDGFSRRGFVMAVGAAAVGLRGVARAQQKPAEVIPPDVAWHDVTTWGVEGRAWDDTERYFDRFPARAKKMVPPPVWGLSRDSAGMCARFESDASVIYVKYKLTKSNLAMPHMAATGVSGLDLYGRDENGKDHWLAVARPSAQNVEAKLAAGDPLPGGKPRLFHLYLPLYNGVESLSIGVAPKSKFDPLAPRKDKPIVFYGTSILHGCSASRPGMAFTNILGRRFDRPTINLGFSGNGKMDAGVVELLAELDPCVYVIDCVPNMPAELVAERAPALIKRLREARPATPILLVEDRTYSNATLNASVREMQAGRRAALRKAYDEALAAGAKGLSYLPGDSILGTDDEATVDGSHPNDLGMMRYADVYERALRPLLGSAKS